MSESLESLESLESIRLERMRDTRAEPRCQLPEQLGLLVQPGVSEQDLLLIGSQVLEVSGPQRLEGQWHGVDALEGMTAAERRLFVGWPPSLMRVKADA